MSIDLQGEPVGRAYAQLIAAARASCATFSLAWRDKKVVDERVVDELGPHLLRKERTNKWPGTTLGGGQLATVCFYHLNDFSAGVLRRAERLYAWQHPDRPEDLAFYSASSALWFGSIAHEADAWFADSVCLEFIRQVMPALQVAEHPSPAAPPPNADADKGTKALGLLP
jgi:hypothetical protein